MTHWRSMVAAILLALAATVHAEAAPPYGSTCANGANSPASHVFDENAGTVWNGDASKTVWRCVYGWSDVVAFQGFFLDFGSAAATATANVDVSLDGTTWTRVVSDVTLQHGAYGLAVMWAQWVRLTMTGAVPALQDMRNLTGGTPPPGTKPPAHAAGNDDIMADLGGGGGSAPPPPSPPPPSGCVNVSWGAANTVTVGGDSITQGVGREKPPYVELLPEWRPDLVFYNQGQGGHMTQNMLNAMPTITATGARTYLVMIGGNDVQNANALATIIANIGLIVDALHCAGGAVVLIGPTPRYATLAPALQAYDTALSAYAAAHGLAYVSVWNAVADGAVMRADLTDDGTHPNARGRRVLARAIAHGLGWAYAGD